MRKKSLLKHIVSIVSKVKDDSFTIYVDKNEKKANVTVYPSLFWDELEPISKYCDLHDINWKIESRENALLIEIWEDNES